MTTYLLNGKHHDYQLKIAVPDQSPPEKGYPVLYILDSNAYFTMFHEMIRLQSRRAEKTGVEPMLLVGIGYQEEKPFSPFRVYDFTPPAGQAELPDRPDGTPWPEHGGAADFLQLLQGQVLPYVQQHYPIDQQKQTLFGHSLGGLFALYALFQEPVLFSHYFVCSPSIWWNQQAILSWENKHDLSAVKGLFIAAEQVAKQGMYNRALSLYERLSTAYPNVPIDFASPEGENHMSIVPTVFSRGMRFLHEASYEGTF